MLVSNHYLYDVNSFDNLGKEMLFTVSFTAQFKGICSWPLNGLCMCHVYDNGGINNSKNKPLAKLACLLTLAFRSMFGEGKKRSSWPGQWTEYMSSSEAEDILI